ncbi:hypothetical protein [Candidatus Pyrohabitans sp.]
MRGIILLLSFTLLIGSVSASSVEEERELEVGVYDDYVEVMSYFENESYASRLEIKFYTEGGEGPLSMEFEYAIEAGAAEEEVEIRVTFHKLIEFIDRNGDGAFSEAVDEVIKEVFLGDRGVVIYRPPSFEKITAGSSTGFKLKTQGETPEGTDFGITGIVFNTPATVGKVQIKPSEMKILVEISDFPFEEDNSRLALKAKVYSEKGVEIEDGEYFYAESETSLVYFDWSGDVTVDGVSTRGEVSPTASDGEWFVYITYPRGTKIVHDPKAGVVLKGVKSPMGVMSTMGTQPSEKGICGPTAALIITLVPLFAFGLMRKKN